MDAILHPKKDKKNDESRKPREEKRKSLVLRPGSKSRDRNASSSPALRAVRPARFETTIESSPLVMIHNAQNSTGALLSTKIKLLVDDPSGQVTLNKWSRTLRVVSTTKKPVGKDCQSCAEHIEILSKADIITKPKTYYASNDNFVPFQFLFEGHLAATTYTALGSVHYELRIEATTSNNEKITYNQPLVLHRAIPESPPKASIRIFPPTNLTGRVQLPPVVYPIGKFPITMALSGVVEKREASTTRWRLRKMMWRIEEHTSIDSMPCSQHANRTKDGKAVTHTETTTLGNSELKSGWKSDFDTAGGEIMVEFEASVTTNPKHKSVCDVAAPSGLKVSHNLVIELIVAEEFLPNKNTQMITPTGAARVLRMQFALHVTQRAGMGISWDEEMPPTYDDVPESPPCYPSDSQNSANGVFAGAEILDYTGPELESTELERIQTDDPSAPPMYRERPQDFNAGLLMRSGDLAEDEVEAGPSRRPARFTLDELEAEPEPWRNRQNSAASREEEQPDIGEGSAT
jgi:arrestin-related trafficking adapter 1